VRLSESSKEETVVNGSYRPEILFPGAEIEKLTLLPHRPLGMTIEESLADSRFVLVTKVVDGGNANKAGIAVGDVLVGITGLFGDLTNVIGLEVESM
jgi:predicted metalloprotease with PDZ domain